MKKYLAESQRNTINQVEILKETKSSVFIPNQWYPQGQRYDKISETKGYFDTFDEGREFLIGIEESKIATLTRELDRRQKAIDKIKEMGQP